MGFVDFEKEEEMKKAYDALWGEIKIKETTVEFVVGRPRDHQDSVAEKNMRKFGFIIKELPYGTT